MLFHFQTALPAHFGIIYANSPLLSMSYNDIRCTFWRTQRQAYCDFYGYCCKFFPPTLFHHQLVHAVSKIPKLKAGNQSQMF